MTYIHTQPEQASRQVIDVAVGILIGLRGCSQREAFNELAAAVRASGVGLTATARALVELANGASASPLHRQEAMKRWGHLLAAAPAPTGPGA
jgi:ANTAR domain